jgi:DNA-binding response OmpR family regulator
MAHVVMQVTSAPANPPVASMLEVEGFELSSCLDGRALLESVVHRHPDVVVYALKADCREDLGVLRLVRRAAPEVPLVLIAADDSFDTRKMTQPLRPIFYVVAPVDGAELRDALHAAVTRRGGR